MRGQTSVPSFNGRDYDFDGRLGIRIARPRIYLAGAFMSRRNNYGYPIENGAGIGLEKLPDLDRPFSFQGSVYYFFDVNGNYTGVGSACGGAFTAATTCTQNVGYNVLKYDLGVTYSLQGIPLFFEAGFVGDRGYNLNASPIGFSESGPYGGIGIKI